MLAEEYQKYQINNDGDGERNAFYAGALVMLSLMTQNCKTNNINKTGEFIKELREEIEMFARDNVDGFQT